MKKLFSALLALAIVCAPLYLAFLALDWLSGLESDDRNTILAAGAAISVPIVAFFGNQRLERRRSMEEHSRKKKIEIYESMIKFFMSMMFGGTREVPQDEMLDTFQELTPQLMTYASNGVVKKWGHLRVYFADPSPKDNKTTMKNLEGLFKEMRKDVGHSALTLTDGDILRMFINDIDDILKPTPKEA